jgi:hypothetical protein
MGVSTAVHPLKGWTPARVDWNPGGPTVRWCFTEGVEFTDPFFDDTLRRCIRNPFRALFWRDTPLNALGQFARAQPGLEPAGFIFHGSRCGSTLVSQMLASLPTALVMSEPGPFDAVARPPTRTGGHVALDGMRWMASALGQPRHAGQSRFVVKLDAWAILQFPLFRRAFPDVPCVFVYRDPVEVVASHLRHRGYHMIPGTLPAEWFGLSECQATSMSPERFCAAVLAALYESAATARRDGDLDLVSYTSLPDAVATVIAPRFGIDVTAFGDMLGDVSGRDAKNPAIPFDPDRHVQGLAPRACAEVAAVAGPAYEALKRLDARRS